MKTIPFWKMSGSGNDFIVADNRRGVFPKNVSAWAKKLCYRQEGVGADGLLLVEKSRKARFRMVYYNADGSRASMCGNGARCIAQFAQDHGIAKSPFAFETDAGVVQAELGQSAVRIQMNDARDYRPDLSVRVLGVTYPVSFIDTGVPHAVCFVRRADAVDLPRVGRALRSHRLFGPQGANVDFVERLRSDALKVRTYERGVEGETLACGTGVTASAIVAGLKGLVQIPVRCLTRGGDWLEVSFAAHAHDRRRPASEIYLQGPVRVTFKGEFYV